MNDDPDFVVVCVSVSLTLVSSTLVMEPLVMSMDTSGSRVVLMVRLLFSLLSSFLNSLTWVLNNLDLEFP